MAAQRRRLTPADTRGPAVQVIIPARNEERAIGSIVRSLGGRGHEAIVVDSASTDATGASAAASGAQVIRSDLPGKGRALRLGVAAASAEVVVFCDADLAAFDPGWIDRLGAPLSDPGVHLVKPVYGRPLRRPGGEPAAGEGGRVTEILARPLLSALAPDVAGLAQPLAGEYAARRRVLMECGFPDGYGVEIALLLQIAERYGARSVAEVDLHADRWHRNRSLHELSAIASDVLRSAMTVLENQGRLRLERPTGVELIRPAAAGRTV